MKVTFSRKIKRDNWSSLLLYLICWCEQTAVNVDSPSTLRYLHEGRKVITLKNNSYFNIMIKNRNVT